MRSLKASLNRLRTTTGVTVAALLVISPSAVQAFSLVTDRTALGANDQVNWSRLGFTPPLTVLPNTFSTTSEAGLGLQVEIPPATPGITPPLLFLTAPPPAGIPTNFASGDFILFTGLAPGVFPSPGNPGPLTILFDQPVYAAGAQIAVDDTPLFTAFISAFDTTNTLLGTFAVPGTASTALDNSAIFLGVRNETPNISKLVFSSSIPDRGIGINTLSLNNAAVPEPSSLLALGLAGFGLFAARRKKSSIERDPAGD